MELDRPTFLNLLHQFVLAAAKNTARALCIQIKFSN
jgi:hypothetical protein